MTLLCPLCIGVNFSTPEALLYDLITSATRNIMCPLCSEVLKGIDKFTVHLCSHVLKCDLNPITLKIDENVVNLNEKLESIHLHRTSNDTQPVDLHSSPSCTDKVLSSEKNSSQVSSQSNYLVQFNKESETRNENLRIGLEIGNISEPLGTNIADDFPFGETLDIDFEPLLQSGDIVEPESSAVFNEQNILHVDFLNENVPVVVIPNEAIREGGSDRINCNECALCSTTFPNSAVLTLHNELVHGENDKNMSSFKHQCDQCQKKFKIRGGLLIHQRVAHRISGGIVGTYMIC